jgi:hypothetical protein
LTRQLALDEADLEDLKEAILFAHLQVVDEAGRSLVWTGAAGAVPLPAPDSPQPVEPPVTLTSRGGQTAVPPPVPSTRDRVARTAGSPRGLTPLTCRRPGRYAWSCSDNRETFTRDMERQEHDGRVHHTTSYYGHARRSHFGTLSGYRRRVPHHAAGWQRH